MEIGSGDCGSYVAPTAAKVEIRRGPFADGISKVNGSDFSGTSGRENAWLLSGSSGDVGGGFVAVDTGVVGCVASVAASASCCRR